MIDSLLIFPEVLKERSRFQRRKLKPLCLFQNKKTAYPGMVFLTGEYTPGCTMGFVAV